MFVEQMMVEEIARKPEYYDGITDAHLAEDRRKVLADEAERRERLIRDFYEREK